MIWKSIPGCDYEASDEGLIRSVDREVPANGRWGPEIRRYKGKVLRKQKHPWGYPTVRIPIDGKLVTRTIHSLTMEAFAGPCPDGMETRHLDSNPTNGRLDNLEYATPTKNNADKVGNGTDNRGEKHWNRRISDDDVRRIRRLFDMGVSRGHLASAYELSYRMVCRIVDRSRWKHI